MKFVIHGLLILLLLAGASSFEDTVEEFEDDDIEDDDIGDDDIEDKDFDHDDSGDDETSEMLRDKSRSGDDERIDEKTEDVDDMNQEDVEDTDSTNRGVQKSKIQNGSMEKSKSVKTDRKAKGNDVEDKKIGEEKDEIDKHGDGKENEHKKEGSGSIGDMSGDSRQGSGNADEERAESEDLRGKVGHISEEGDEGSGIASEGSGYLESSGKDDGGQDARGIRHQAGTADEEVEKESGNSGDSLEGSGSSGDSEGESRGIGSIRGLVETSGENSDEGSGDNGEGSGRGEDMRYQVEQLTGGIEEATGISGEGSGNHEAAITNIAERGTSGDTRGHFESRNTDTERARGGDEKESTHADERNRNDEETTSGDDEASGSLGTAGENEKGTSEDTHGSTGKRTHELSDEDGTTINAPEDEAESNLLSSGSGDEGSGGSTELMKSDKDQAKSTAKAMQDKNQNVENLLKDLVPSGILPDVPEGFGKISDMSTISFTYNVDENDEVTVTSDVKEPLQMFDGKLTLTNTKMTFYYRDKQKKGQRWQLEAQATWVNGEQTIDVMLESSNNDNHFVMTGEGESLALKDYISMFITEDILAASRMDTHTFDKTTLSGAQIYLVFKNEENVVSLVTGKVDAPDGKPGIYKTYIQKFPGKTPAFSTIIDFQNGTPHSVLSSVMDGKLSNISFVKQLLDNKGPLKIANGGFSFVASSADIDKSQVTVFGEEILEGRLGHISSGVTLMLPLVVRGQSDIEEHTMAVRVSEKLVHFLPSSNEDFHVSKAFKTLSEFTRPKIISLGYPDMDRITVEELTYDIAKRTYTVIGHTEDEFNLIPGMLSLEVSTLEFRQLVPDQFATLALFGYGTTTMGASKLNVSVETDSVAGDLVIKGEAQNLWTVDIGFALGVALEADDDTKKILGDNKMLNMNIENARMFTIVKNGHGGSIHFYGFSRPASWNDPVEVETVVYHDRLENKKRITIGYVFDKLPLAYAIDALSFGQFPSPRLLDNSRNTTLVLSPTNTDSLFLNQAMNGLSFMRGLSLIGQFRLPDVCSMNTRCESAAQLLGTEKWYRVQGLVSLKGFTLAGYVDKDFTLAKGLTLRDNIMEFALGNYSYMGISTALHLDKSNLTFRGYINFDSNGVRLRMSSNDVWSHPFPGTFVAFDRMQIDVPFVSGIPLDEFLATGELNFGLPGSLYRIFAPAYLTFKTSDLGKVGFQATLSNITMETIINSLNYKSTLPDVLRNSRFPESLVVRYTPGDRKTQELEFYGKLRVLERTLICKMRIDDTKRILATTSHSKYPMILDDGLVMVYADQNHTQLGPRVSFKVTPEKTNFKVEGYATFMGLGTNTEIDVSESGTDFSLDGNLFGLTKTVVSIMSPDGLPKNGPYIASACIPEVIPKVVSRVKYLVSMAADQAERYMKDASRNFQQANVYHNEALAKESKYKAMVGVREADVEMDNRKLFEAEELFNRTCKQEHCDKTCIGCTAWRKCCDRDVFGNCVSCPGWKACCWRGKNPICKAKNHGCRIMKQLAAENLQRIAKRVYQEKKKKQSNDESLWQSEYLKGKTQAVLDAARRALNLVNHDSQVGLGAAASIKKFGIQRLVNIQSVCFQTTLKTLATSCVGMRINASFGDRPGTRSIPYYGCLNGEIIPKMASHIINYMFPGTPNSEKQRGNDGKDNSSGVKSQVSKSALEDVQLDDQKEYERRRREENDGDVEDRPFWLIRDNHPMHNPSLQQRANVPRSPLRKKWQIPASKEGKCKVYRQLMEICKDMMSTVQIMYKSYQEGKEQFLKRRTELELGLNTTIADLEKQAAETPELNNRLSDIEMNVRTVNAGVGQWRLNCKQDQEEQNNVAIQEWVRTMEGRITRLGGQGVDRFLSNLFRAFEGMFLGSDTPKSSAEDVLNTLQAIREISATFHDIFSSHDITLEKANSRAEIVLAQLRNVKKAQLFCD